MKRSYSVWVGGVEVNQFYLTKKEAEETVKYFKDKGYDDVAMRKER